MNHIANKNDKNRWSRRTGKELHADPPACIFAVQKLKSNYINLKQTQKIDTLVAKFPTAHGAAPHIEKLGSTSVVIRNWK